MSDLGSSSSNRDHAPQTQPTLQGEPYKVGYGKPPKHTRFGAGPLANRSGRRKKQKPSLGEVLKRELDQVLVVRSRGRNVRKTRMELTIQAWVDRVLQGDFRPLTQLMRIINKTDYFEDKSVLAPFTGVVVWPKEFERDEANGATDGKVYVFRDRVIRWHDARPETGDEVILETLRMATKEEMENGRVG